MKKSEAIKKEIERLDKNIDASTMEVNGMQVYKFDLGNNNYSLETGAAPKETFFKYEKEHSLVKHPIDRYLLSSLSKVEPNHSAALDIKASTVARARWQILNDDNNKINKFLKTPNLNLSDGLNDILYKLAYDFEVFDDAYLEVIKLSDDPNDCAMYHVSARDIKIEPIKKDNGQIIPGSVKKYHQVILSGGKLFTQTWEPLRRNTKMIKGQKYMINLSGNSTTSSFYGEPVYYSAISAIAENMVIKKYIYSFFKNNASPNIAIVVTGSSLKKEQQAEIKKQIKSMKGADNSHSLLVLTFDQKEARVTIKELQESVDGDFLKEREINRSEILQTHLVPPKLLGISQGEGLSSGSEMIGAMKEFLEVIVDPKQRKLASLLDRILEKMFGIDPRFQFLPYNITNEKDRAVIYNLLANIVDELGKPALTVDEIRVKEKMPKEIDGNKAPPSKYKENKNNTEAVNNRGEARSSTNTNSSGNSMDDLEVGTDEHHGK